MIRTPDQRLRVFVSSTLTELSAERTAVKAAIERLKLTPVLFESGARPHPPQDVYRAYLEQSDIFIGIYAASYGWVAPDMAISGLEDEFRSAGTRPRLIYVKSITTAREPRLVELLNTIRTESGISYQKFGTPDELQELVVNDLAVLLSERFGQGAVVPAIGSAKGNVPALRGPSIGRGTDLQAITERLLEEGTGLVTITGPGGTGKTRMGLLVAHHVRGRFADGTVFVPLASINDPALVAPAIASALGSYDNARRSAIDLLKDILHEKHLLLVLDNFEQVLSAAPLLTELLAHCPHVRIIVTSRTPLHLRGEQVYPLGPLQEPRDPEAETIAELLATPSVDLFVQRAREASAHVELDEVNVRAIATICKKLDGLPLAIELAAAHMRVLTPVALQQRMEHALALLTRGARDLPERQRTMRSTIAWSHDLLDENTRSAFRRLGVFADRFTLADAHAITGSAKEEDTMATLEQLVDHGLLRTFPPIDRSQGSKLFAMLHIVREFALEELDANSERKAIGRVHAAYFSAQANRLEHKLLREENRAWLEQMGSAQADMRAAFWHWIDAGDRASAWRSIADQRAYWGHAGNVSEAFKWMEVAGIYPLQDPPDLSNMDQGRTLTAAGLAVAVSGAFGPAADLLEQAVLLLETNGEGPELSRALNYLGLAQLSKGARTSMATLQRAVELAIRIEVDFDACMALSFLCEACIATGNLDGARATLERARPIAERHRSGSAEAMYVQQCGNLELVMDRATEALTKYEESTRLFDASRMLPLSGWSWWGIGYASFKLGLWDRSMEGFSTSLDRARRTSDSAMVSAAMLSYALFAHARGDLEKAGHLLGAAEAIAQAIGYAFWSTDKVQYEDVKHRLQVAMKREQFEAAVARGKHLTQEEAIAMALEIEVRSNGQGGEREISRVG